MGACAAFACALWLLFSGLALGSVAHSGVVHQRFAVWFPFRLALGDVALGLRGPLGFRRGGLLPFFPLRLLPGRQTRFIVVPMTLTNKQ